jgi:hypothetical protein
LPERQNARRLMATTTTINALTAEQLAEQAAAAVRGLTEASKNHLHAQDPEDLEQVLGPLASLARESARCSAGRAVRMIRLLHGINAGNPM